MSSNDTASVSPQPGMIITDDMDDISLLHPILDLEAYSDAIVKMIKESYPKFSIGIYGEWGSGKTTLMKVIKEKLNPKNSDNNEDILTVWFNAWRYEREDQFALIALLKTIAYKIGEQEKYDEVKNILIKSIITAGKGLASKYILPERYVEELHENVTSQMKKLAEADKDTIYFHGLKQIEDIMKDIVKSSPRTRIVVFIDDLDRCSPKKALEVFESIKVFLDIDGFVYVIGLSHITISKLITAQYKESEIKGEQYIKKIIQIPIILPEWNPYDIKSLVDHLLRNNLINKNYEGIIQDNAKLISEVVERNPRDVKRFINNYIVAYEIYSSKKNIDPTHLLLVQVINVRWNSFYRLMVSSTPEMREEINKYAKMNHDELTTRLESKRTEEGFSPVIKGILSELKLDYEFWNFLKEKYDVLLKIDNWEDYRRAAESTKEIPAPKEKTISDRSFQYGLVSFLFDQINTALDRLIAEGKIERIDGNTLLEAAKYVESELNFSYEFSIARSFLSELALVIEGIEQKHGASAETRSLLDIIKKLEDGIRKVKILMDLFISEDTDLLAPGFFYWYSRTEKISLQELEAFAADAKRSGLAYYDIFKKFKKWVNW